MDAEYGYAYYFRANTYLTLSDFVQAIEDYSLAIDLEVELGQSHFNRAVAQFNHGYQSKAILDFQMVLEVSQDPQLIERTNEILASFGIYPSE